MTSSSSNLAQTVDWTIESRQYLVPHQGSRIHPTGICPEEYIRMTQRKLRSHLLCSAGGLALFLLTGCGGASFMTEKELRELNVSCHYSVFIVKHLWSKFDFSRDEGGDNYPPGQQDGTLYIRKAYEGVIAREVREGDEKFVDTDGRVKTRRYYSVFNRNTKYDLAALITNEVKRDIIRFRRECKIINYSGESACAFSTVQHTNYSTPYPIYHTFIFKKFDILSGAEELYLEKILEAVPNVPDSLSLFSFNNTYPMVCQREQALVAMPLYEKYRNEKAARYERYRVDIERKSK